MKQESVMEPINELDELSDERKAELAEYYFKNRLGRRSKANKRKYNINSHSKSTLEIIQSL